VRVLINRPGLLSFQKYYILISKSQIKLITGLQQKKYRDKSGLFVAEGPKVIGELIRSGMNLHLLFATERMDSVPVEPEIITSEELQKISFLKSPNTALAIFEIPETNIIGELGLVIALDAVRDPGNLGTIIRLCDWFGVAQLVCSEDTADCYNPKVIQATMGSISRVQVHYTNLEDYLQRSSLPVFGAVMDGDSVYGRSLPADGILVMGNEANGISPAIDQFIDFRITIPRFGKNQVTESLNVATATAILLSEFRRATET
jgi:TrmH family RNA methyltransferase